jgi:hypothetical protein
MVMNIQELLVEQLEFWVTSRLLWRIIGAPSTPLISCTFYGLCAGFEIPTLFKLCCSSTQFFNFLLAANSWAEHFRFSKVHLHVNSKNTHSRSLTD